MTESIDQKVEQLMCMHGNAIENMRGLHQADSKRWTYKLEAALRTELGKDATAQAEPVGTLQYVYEGGHVGYAINMIDENIPDGAPLYTTPPSPSIGGEVTDALKKAHELGFLRCAGWAQRDDLFADVGSATYRKDRDHDLSSLAATPTKPDAKDAEDVLWQLLNAVTDEMNRRAIPGTWLSLAYKTGSEFITNRRAAIASTKPDPLKKLVELSEELGLYDDKPSEGKP